jgi:hypothetical protein
MEMGASNGIYDAADGKFILTVEKVNKGEYFPNLDLISTLMVKKTKNFPSKPNIRILGKTIVSIYCLLLVPGRKDIIHIYICLLYTICEFV